jgi:L-lactate utilization protein LutB
MSGQKKLRSNDPEIHNQTSSNILKTNTFARQLLCISCYPCGKLCESLYRENYRRADTDTFLLIEGKGEYAKSITKRRKTKRRKVISYILHFSLQC